MAEGQASSAGRGPRSGCAGRKWGQRRELSRTGWGIKKRKKEEKVGGSVEEPLVVCRGKGLEHVYDEAESTGVPTGFWGPEGVAGPISARVTLCQEWLHNLRGSVQNENVGLLVQKVLRIPDGNSW